MKVMFDANILLDIFQYREGYYKSSAACLEKVLDKSIEGVIPAHILTTFYYVLKKYGRKQEAHEAVCWLLESFTVAACDHVILLGASQSGISDFEDAVVAVSAKQTGCAYLLTRNIKDFIKSPVPVISPDTLLEEVGNGEG